MGNNVLLQELLKKTQITQLDADMIVQSSEGFVLPLVPGDCAMDFHPIFYSLAGMIDQNEQDVLRLPGVSVADDTVNLVVQKNDAGYKVIFQNATTHYEYLQGIAQRSNESGLVLQELTQEAEQLRAQHRTDTDLIVKLADQLLAQLDNSHHTDPKNTATIEVLHQIKSYGLAVRDELPKNKHTNISLIRLLKNAVGRFQGEHTDHTAKFHLSISRDIPERIKVDDQRLTELLDHLLASLIEEVGNKSIGISTNLVYRRDASRVSLRLTLECRRHTASQQFLDSAQMSFPQYILTHGINSSTMMSQSRILASGLHGDFSATQLAEPHGILVEAILHLEDQDNIQLEKTDEKTVTQLSAWKQLELIVPVSVLVFRNEQIHPEGLIDGLSHNNNCQLFFSSRFRDCIMLLRDYKIDVIFVPELLNDDYDLQDLIYTLGIHNIKVPRIFMPSQNPSKVREFYKKNRSITIYAPDTSLDDLMPQVYAC